MSYKDVYNSWLLDPVIDSDTKAELRAIEDEKEIEDRFYKDLEFGTAGLRGKLGAGTNRMNKYVIAKATDAFAKVILSFGQEAVDRGVAIAFDSRNFSTEFSQITATTLAANGIKVYLFESLRPTPELSYAVRYYNCIAGVNITASHNPKDYNGYKVYWQEGSQIKDEIGDKILQEYKKIDGFESIPTMSFQKAVSQELIKFIGEEVDESFLAKVMETSLRDSEIDKSISVVYSPLNGAGSIPVQKVLFKRGFTNIHVVAEQEMPDGNFPTIDYPNPEDTKAFEYALALAESVKGELLVATDPDCDRVAAIVKHKDDYVAMTGNQTGVLLINYILSSMREKNLIKPNSVIVKSIVTGEMGVAIANDYGVEMISVLTGFKNICALPNEYELTGEKNYIMGFEESIGYNIGTFVRDKDAVAATMLLVEAAAFYKGKGRTLVDVLNELFSVYGYYNESTTSIVLEGIEGQKRIARMMDGYRTSYPTEIGTSKLAKIYDYKTLMGMNLKNGGEFEIDSEPTNAIKFLFDDGCWYALRPSGTEPKIKVYIYSKSDNQDESGKKLEEFKEVVLTELNKID